jgi:hypothetical protein
MDSEIWHLVATCWQAKKCQKVPKSWQVFCQFPDVTGYVPSTMVCCITNFMDACYIAHQNAITSPSLEHFHHCVNTFQELCNIFITTHV